jgi:Ca-activated chloride channel family protein
MSGELTLQCTPIRESLKEETPQLTHVLVETMPTGANVVNVQSALNCAFVLDRSASMNGEKIMKLREAVKLLIDQFTPNDIISIVIFDELVEVLVPSQPAANPVQLKQLVDSVEDRGGTQMSLGLQQGLTEIASAADPTRVSRIILLTDGNTWGDEDMCLSMAQQAGMQNVQISAFGLGAADDWNHILLDSIAQASHGKSDLIDLPAQIIPMFQTEMTSMKGTLVRNAQLLLRMVPNVTPRQVWQILPMISNLGARPIGPTDVQVSLGDVENVTGKSVLVELTLPTKPAGKFRIAQAEVTYDVPASNVFNEKVRADIILNFGAESAVNPKVANIVEKISAFKLQTRALQDAQAGNVAGATQKLRQAATRLLELGENDLAQQAMLETQNLQQQGQMSGAGTKRLQYGTRKLTQKLPE